MVRSFRPEITVEGRAHGTSEAGFETERTRVPFVVLATVLVSRKVLRREGGVGAPLQAPAFELRVLIASIHPGGAHEKFT